MIMTCVTQKGNTKETTPVIGGPDKRQHSSTTFKGVYESKMYERLQTELKRFQTDISGGCL
jgi:hypothetical protein